MPDIARSAASAPLPSMTARLAKRALRCLALGAALVAAGCAEEKDFATSVVPPPEGELLNALGYVDYGDPTGDTATGTTVFDTERSAPGLNVVTYPALQRAEVIDATGRMLAAWVGNQQGVRWERAIPVPGGDILVILRPAGLIRLAPDGSTRWHSKVPVHHHAQVLPDGRIAALTQEKRRVRGFSRPQVVDNGIAILSAEGELLEEVSLLEVARDGEHEELLQEPSIRSSEERPLDLFHTNRLHWLTPSDFPEGGALMRPGRVLVTVRHQNSIVLLDWAQRKIVWSWGRGEVGPPHDGTVLPTGNVLIFDNEAGPDWSRVLEVDPSDGQVVWSYVAPVKADLQSRTRGTAQRMGGGTTLIGESNRGRAFEVTASGEIVWEYQTPHRSEEGAPAALRIERFEEALLGPMLSGLKRDGAGV